jgi:hypothetical protein
MARLSIAARARDTCWTSVWCEHEERKDMQGIQIPDCARQLLEGPAAPAAVTAHRIYAGCGAPLD